MNLAVVDLGFYLVIAGLSTGLTFGTVLAVLVFRYLLKSGHLSEETHRIIQP